MKIQLIAQGSTKQERKSLRWGISFLVGDVLFDTFGRADVFRKNVRRFRVSLSPVRKIVISHEDWDHIAGLERLLRLRPGSKVYLCKKTGAPLTETVRKAGGKIVRVDGPRRIARNIFSLGQMRADTGRGVLYEQALVIKSKNGFSIVTGCAHPGIARIVKRARQVFGDGLYAVCGGFHMKDQTREENERIVTELRDLGVKKVIPLHCTGAGAVRLFRKRYGTNCISLKEGSAREL